MAEYAVLISIRPEWVKKILAGEKTLEIRKTRPHVETPFKCYIYCTNSGVAMGMWGKHGKVVGEFLCDKITWLTHVGFSGLSGVRLAAMKDRYTIDDSFDFSRSSLTMEQIEKYLDGKDGYVWHISDLLIYDQPRELTEFRRPCPNDLYCEACAMYSNNGGICNNGALSLCRPPQSWRYVLED